jgi:hypothetical protein
MVGPVPFVGQKMLLGLSASAGLANRQAWHEVIAEVVQARRGCSEFSLVGAQMAEASRGALVGRSSRVGCHAARLLGWPRAMTSGGKVPWVRDVEEWVVASTCRRGGR